jgi:hypothetical protein
MERRASDTLWPVPPPPPELPLSPAVLAALGLAVGCTAKGACLTGVDSSFSRCLVTTPWDSGGDSADTGDTGTTTATTGDTGDSADTGATGTPTSADTGAPADTATDSRGAALDRLEAEGVLPPDVLARIRRRER